MTVTVKAIVKTYLTKNGFDGLYSDDCGCFIRDLMPCDGYYDIDIPRCKPGYRRLLPDGDFIISGGFNNDSEL